MISQSRHLVCRIPGFRIVRTLWKETAELASKEGTTAVQVLQKKNKPGGLVVIHEDDFDRVIEEGVKASQADLIEGVA